MTSVMSLISGPVPAAEPRVALGDLGVLQLSRKSLCFSSRRPPHPPDSSTFSTRSLEVEADKPRPDPYSAKAYHPPFQARHCASTRPWAQQVQLVPGGGRFGGTRSQTLETSLSLSSQQYQRPNNLGGLGESRLYQVTALPLAGVDEVGGHPSGYGEQGSKMEKGPAQS